MKIKHKNMLVNNRKKAYGDGVTLNAELYWVSLQSCPKLQ